MTAVDSTPGPHRTTMGAVERYEHEPTSPAGQIDAWGDLATGLRSNRSGRRRAARMLAWLVVVVLVLTGLLVLALR